MGPGIWFTEQQNDTPRRIRSVVLDRSELCPFVPRGGTLISSTQAWEHFHAHQSGNAYPETPIVRFVFRHFGTHRRPEVSILDVGCGSGNHLLFLSQEGFAAHGLDFSGHAVERAREMLANRGLTARLDVSEMSSIPHPDRSMDAVIDGAAIQHAEPGELPRVFSEIHRVLKDSGRFFGMIIAGHRQLSAEDFPTHFFTKEELRELLAEFQDLTIDHLEYTEDNSEKSIKFWLVEAQKHA